MSVDPNKSSEADLYTRWLGLPATPRPVDHYLLLGLPAYTSDPVKLRAAAEHQLELLEKYTLSADRKLREACQDLMDEIARALTTLLDAAHRQEYDATLVVRYPDALRAVLAASAEAAAWVGPQKKQVVEPVRAAAPARVEAPPRVEAPARVEAPVRQPVSRPRQEEKRTTPSRESTARPPLNVKWIAIATSIAAAVAVVLVLTRSGDETEPGDDGSRGAADVVVTPPDVKPPDVKPPDVKSPPDVKPAVPIPQTALVQRVNAQTMRFDLGGRVAMRLIRVPVPLVNADGTTTKVTGVDRPYYIGEMEVTEAQWERVMYGGAEPANAAEREQSQLPKGNVSWADAKAFCHRLSVVSGRTVRMPSTDEWRHACRGGVSAFYSFGNDAQALGDHAWYAGNTPGRRKGGLKKPNGFGLYDMHGNMAEVTDVEQGALGTAYVVGGGWQSSAAQCRLDSSILTPLDTSLAMTGFRVVMEIKDGDDALPMAAGEDVNPPTVGPKVAVLNPENGEIGAPGAIKVGDVVFPLVMIGAGESHHRLYATTIENAFYLGTTEVTRAQWEAVMGTRPWGDGAGANNPERPATHVSYQDVFKFCLKLSEKTKRNVRLPTDYEWRYACFAGAKTEFFFGDSDELMGEYAWCLLKSGDTPQTESKPVGRKKPNPWGLYDIYGNVREMCMPKLDNPGGAPTPGGAFDELPKAMNFHQSVSHTTKDERTGFRIVVEPRPVPSAVQWTLPWNSWETPRQANASLKLTPNVTMEVAHMPAGRVMVPTEREPRVVDAFQIGVTEVTRAQWVAVMGTQPWKGTSGFVDGDDRPATHVTRDDARAFCAKMSELTKRKVRLPIRAQWEHACRAGFDSQSPFGVEVTKLEDYAWYKQRVANPVAKKKPNPWGLFDVLGNVSEWSEQTSPSYEYVQGGSYTDDWQWLLVQTMRNVPEGTENEKIGFRVVVEWDGVAPPVVPDVPRVDPGPVPSVTIGGKNELDQVAVAQGVAIQLVKIDKGEYLQGKERLVKIDQPFYLGKTEVTRAQWEAVMGTRPWDDREGAKDDQRPAVSVSFEEVNKFCAKLSEKSKRKVRLPTYNEWDYACLAGATTLFHFGDDGRMMSDYAWYGADKETRPVAAKKPNVWGLYDTYGNVREMCESYTTGPRTMGGAVGDSASSMQRGAYKLLGTNPNPERVGFRIVIEMDGVAAPAAQDVPGTAPREEGPSKPTEMLKLFGRVELPVMKIEVDPVKGANARLASRHAVTVAYEIGVTEVTREQWQAVMRTKPWGEEAAAGDGKLPATHVSRKLAEEFCKRTSLITKRTVRLPKPGEWQYARHNGSEARYSFGDDINLLDDYAWCEGGNTAKPREVATKKPSPWGLYDMYGNVRELVDDEDEKGRPIASGGSCRQSRVLRRTSGFALSSKDDSSDVVGFRVVVEVKEAEGIAAPVAPLPPREEAPKTPPKKPTGR